MADRLGPNNRKPGGGKSTSVAVDGQKQSPGQESRGEKKAKNFETRGYAE